MTEACLSGMLLHLKKKKGGGGQGEISWREDSDMFIPLENNSFDLQGGVWI